LEFDLIDLVLLDQAAALTLGGNAAFDAMRALYQNEPRLPVPPLITSYTMDDKKTMVLIGSAG
jgi:hypothetical protein